MTKPSHVVLPGSRRARLPDAVRVGDVDPGANIELTLTLRGPELPEPGEPITRDQLAGEFGASQADVDAVTKAMEANGLKVESADAGTRSVVVSGTADQIETTFRPGLGLYKSPQQGEYRGREGELQVPAELDGIVDGVFGLDERRVARRAQSQSGDGLGPADLESHYAFPPGDAKGQTIAIAEFGGGVFTSDLQAYCQAHNRPVPTVKTVGVAGAHSLTLQEINALPAQQRQEELDESIEVMLDVEIVAGLCSGASIVAYFAPFTQKGWVDLINAVISAAPTAVALSISWGLSEDDASWSQAALTQINQRLQAASLLGITVCVASGDDGSGDQAQDSRAHVDFPASSPYVLGVGGTELSGTKEVVWWESPGDRANGGGSTGGGVSDTFPRPSWQTVTVASLNQGSIDGRVVPDVAALAGSPYYTIVFQGETSANGGTSAATPLWASLLARIQAARPAGTKAAFFTPLLYAQVNGKARGAVLTDITSGNNTSPEPGKGYKAGPGYDACSGWGVPGGAKLLASL